MPRRIAIVVALAVTVAVGSVLLAIGAGAFRGGGEGDDAGQTPTAVRELPIPTTPSAADQQTPASPDATATGDTAGGQGTPVPTDGAADDGDVEDDEDRDGHEEDDEDHEERDEDDGHDEDDDDEHDEEEEDH